MRTGNEESWTPEFELIETGVFDDDRYFDVVVEYAKAGVEDILVRVTVTNHGPEAASLNLLPTIWFRNTWSWNQDGTAKPWLRRANDGVIELNHEHRQTLVILRRQTRAALHGERHEHSASLQLHKRFALR